MRAATSVCTIMLSGLSAIPADAQTDWPRVEAFAGYSFLPAGGDDFPRRDSHGVQASVAVNLSRWFGVAGEVGAHFSETSDLGPGFPGVTAETSVYELLGGPRFTARLPRAALFGHALVGQVIGRSSLSGFEDSGFAMAGGGGVDVALRPRLGLRVQVDVIGTFADIVENNARLAVGVVLH